jgi:hypothetical protein
MGIFELRSKTVSEILARVFSNAHVPVWAPRFGTRYPTLPTMFPTRKSPLGMVFARLPLKERFNFLFLFRGRIRHLNATQSCPRL